MYVVVVGLVAVLGLLPLLVWIARTRSALAAVALAAVFAGFGVQAVRLFTPTGVPEAAIPDRPIQVAEAGDVTSDACQACHPDQYASWDRSYHSTMTQIPSPESIQAPWDIQLRASWTAEDGSHDDRTYVLDRSGPYYFVQSDDPVFSTRTGLEAGIRRIVMVTGSHHEQFFWYATGDKRKIAQFPLAYSIRQERWLPINSVLLSPGGPAADAPGAWNLICVRCHSTHGRPRLLDETDHHLADHSTSRLDTQATEFGIACETCHGGGVRHVEENQNPIRRYAQHVSDAPSETIVNPDRLDSKRATDVCASCHSIHTFGDGSVEALNEFNQVGFKFRPGDDLSKTRFLPTYADRDHPVFEAVLERHPNFFTNRFWADGMISTNGREMNGFLESACFTKGELSCGSCHQMHYSKDDPRSIDEWADDQLDHEKLGNEACLQCHEGYRDRIADHTNHGEGSPGSECMNCHMPNTTYGLLKQTRSHEIDSPSVANTLETGRPNACNLCHLDRTLAWTAENVARWYGQEPLDFEDADHYFVSYSVLGALRGDAGVRAMVGWHMAWEPALRTSGTDWMAPVLAVLLDDPYDAVRHLAVESLRQKPGFESFEYDYIAPEEARQDARERAMALWEQSRSGGEGAGDALAIEHRGGSPTESVLIDHRGQSKQDRIERYLSLRDDRPILRQE